MAIGRLIGTLEAGPRGYRPDIDGLRALAVLAVVAFHAAPGRAPGGFAGVDVFFVVSGFLITGFILAERNAGTFRLSAFYARRIRRIFPALLAVMAACSLAAWLILPDDDLRRFGFHLAAGAAFVPNFAFWSESGYFDVYPYAKPLLHLWSLGVEEQYYITWPVLLLVLLRLPRPALAIAALAAASFLINLAHAAGDTAGAFFSPLSRAWELLLGGLLAALPARPLGTMASWAGALLIAAGFALIRPDSPYPGWVGLLPTVGTLLIVAAGPEAWLNRRILSQPLAVGVGLISYPLYLWHWPLISFAATLTLDALPWWSRAAAVAASLVLALLTWRFVERPIRRRPPRPWPLLGGMAALGLIGLLLWLGPAASWWRPEVDPRREFIAHYRNHPLQAGSAVDDLDCEFGHYRAGIRRRTLPPACTRPGRISTWLLWGDSHARSLAPGLRRALPEGVGLAQVSSGGCQPLVRRGGVCTLGDEYALALIARLRPDVVLLAQRPIHERRDWEAIADRLRALGAGRVVLVGPMPQWQRSLPQIAARHYWPRIPSHIARELRTDILAADRRLERRLRSSRRIGYVSLAAALCRPDGCRAVVPGTGPPRMMNHDAGHASLDGATFVAREILVPAILSSAGRDAAPPPSPVRPAR